MAKPLDIDDVGKAFASLTATLEDLSLPVSEGESAPGATGARRLAEQLIRRLEHCLGKASRLRGRLR